jgi:hypothetical protein
MDRQLRLDGIEKHGKLPGYRAACRGGVYTAMANASKQYCCCILLLLLLSCSGGNPTSLNVTPPSPRVAHPLRLLQTVGIPNCEPLAILT